MACSWSQGRLKLNHYPAVRSINRVTMPVKVQTAAIVPGFAGTGDRYSIVSFTGCSINCFPSAVNIIRL